MPMCRAILVVLVSYAFVTNAADAQTSSTYHLHKEQTVNFDGLDLRPSGPDAKFTVLSTAISTTMVGKTTTVRIFQLAPNVAALGTVMKAGTMVTFTIWMRLTEARGVVYPAAAATNMYPGGQTGNSGAYFKYCDAVGATPLTTTLAPYSFSCVVPTPDVPISSIDHFTLWVAFATQSYTPAKGRRGGASVELGIEGKLGGSADSFIVVTPP